MMQSCGLRGYEKTGSFSQNDLLQEPIFLIWILFEEAVDDLLLGLSFCETQGHELNDLLAGDFADGGFVDKRSFGAVGLQRRNSEDTAIIHDDGIALGMSAAGGVAQDAHVELLVGVVTGDGAGDDVSAGTVAVEDDLIDTVGVLAAMCHQALMDHQSSTCLEFSLCIALCGVNTLDLDHFHFHGAVFFHVDFCPGIQKALACAVSGAIVFLNVFDLCAFADIEAVDTVVLGVLNTAVVDAASGDNDDIAVFTDEEIVVDNFLEAALTHDDRNVNTLILCAGFDLYIDASTVFFGNNIDVCSGVSGGRLAVCPDIEGACGYCMKIRDLAEEPLLDFIYLFNLQHVFLQSLLSC